MTQPQTMPTHPAFASRKVLILALVLGALAAGLIVAYLASQNKAANTITPVVTEQVVVATRDIPIGTTITADMVQLKAVPKESVIADPFTATKPVVGQVTRYPVAKGAQFAQSSLVTASKGTALSFEIPKGMRGVTVPVNTSNDTPSPAALIVPGDYVDVLVAGPAGESVSTAAPGAAPPPAATSGASNNQPPTAVVTIVQDVQVLAVVTTYVENGVPYDTATRGTASNASQINNVTLALTPEQAQTVYLASQTGKITLALRAFGDSGKSTLPPIVGAVQAPTVSP